MWTVVGGLRMFARVCADADATFPPIVLVHGVAVSSRNMAPTAEELAHEFRVYAPDLPGHGNSDHPPRPLDTGELAEALNAWRNAAGLPPSLFVGNSFGCQVIAELAARHPEAASGAVLQGPTIDAFARSRLRQFGRWVLNATREASTQQAVLFKDWRQAGIRTMVAGGRHMFEHRIEDVLPDVRTPTLVVRGSRDPIVSQEWAERVNELLPSGRLAVIRGATHTIPFKYARELAEEVRAFAREISKPAPGGTRGAGSTAGRPGSHIA
jgi:2-hydroxy-6-oxonona-2,4-dienedioate hydrolase